MPLYTKPTCEDGDANADSHDQLRSTGCPTGPATPCGAIDDLAAPPPYDPAMPSSSRRGAPTTGAQLAQNNFDHPAAPDALELAEMGIASTQSSDPVSLGEHMIVASMVMFMALVVIGLLALLLRWIFDILRPIFDFFIHGS